VDEQDRVVAGVAAGGEAEVAERRRLGEDEAARALGGAPQPLLGEQDRLRAPERAPRPPERAICGLESRQGVYCGSGCGS
jgi:hypothetical protein